MILKKTGMSGLFLLFFLTTIDYAQIKEVTEPYVLGPSDVLEINVTPGGDPTKAINRTVTVRPDGNISFDYVGAIPVNGLTPEQVDMDFARYVHLLADRAVARL